LNQLDELIEEAVASLGTGAPSTVNLLGVEAVIIGGGMGVHSGATYMRIQSRSRATSSSTLGEPHVHLSALSDLGGAIGRSLPIGASVVAVSASSRGAATAACR
jgi:hypothetical protein